MRLFLILVLLLVTSLACGGDSECGPDHDAATATGTVDGAACDWTLEDHDWAQCPTHVGTGAQPEDSYVEAFCDAASDDCLASDTGGEFDCSAEELRRSQE